MPYTKETGGADLFTRFLETDVFNYVASKYPVSNYRTLVGHSFGGIFALNILAKHKNLFDNYIVIDPSTWYD
jgi:predicted alpha/beta superfamily hydrolase